MNKPSLLAIDQGTSSSRAILFGLDGNLIFAAQENIGSRYASGGLVEQDPEEIWRTTLRVCQRTVDAAGTLGFGIAAAGIANQRETTVLWERSTGKPLHNAIVWQDRRGAGTCRNFRERGLAPLISSKTGLVPDSYFSATKLQWLLTHIEGARDAAEAGELAFGTIDSFLLWRLTGGRVHATDATNASRTMLFNIHDQKWDPELLDLFDIPTAVLPRVCDSADDFGVISAELLGQEIPVHGVAGDQQAAAVGQVCFEPGMTKCTYGTGAFLLTNVGSVLPEIASGLLGTVACRLNGRVTFAIEGTIFNAGSTVQWLSESMRLVADPPRSSGLAGTVNDNGGVVLVPAFTGLGAPYWDPDARGAIFGLSRDTTPAHIVRAGLEAVAYQTYDLLAASGGFGSGGLLRVDGAMAKNDWLMQFLAETLGVRVERPSVTETTALGAVLLAGLGAGEYRDLKEISRLWREDCRFIPTEVDRSAGLQRWHECVDRVRVRTRPDLKRGR